MKECRTCGEPSKRVQCDKCRGLIATLAPIADAIREYAVRHRKNQGDK